MFNAIYSFFGKLLAAFDSFTGSYLLALFIFALIVKLLLLPFGIKQQKNSIKQAHVRPKEMAIRSKYKGRTDQPTQQRMQKEITDLYEQEGYSPFGGCLPVIIQLPIILVLYKVITNPLQYICGYTTEMINKIAEYLSGLNIAGITLAKDGAFSGYDISLIQHFEGNLEGINAALEGIGTVVMEEIPNFSFFGLGGNTVLAQKPAFLSVLVLVPILNFVFTLFQTWLTKKLTFQPFQEQQNTGSMKFMNLFMAGMITYIAFTVPAAIGIYWLLNNLLGMLQQIILAKTMPLPKFTEEDYKKAEREYMGKGSAKKATFTKTKAALARPMDDDEYADLGDYVSVYDERPTEEEAEPSGKSAIEKAPLKKKNKN